MNCRRVVRLLSAYVDGELTGTEMLEIRRHMRDCASCREEFESTRAAKVLVSRLRTVQPPDGFIEALAARLDEVQVPRYQRLWNSLVGTFHERLTPITAAFVGVSVALIALSARSIDQMPVHPVTMAAVSAPETYHIDVLDPRIQPVKTDPLYSVPIPMDHPDGTFTAASLRW